MADSVELRMSVTSIKRVDPYVKEILATSTHVALYKFNPSVNEWEKTETEGALFLYSRNGEPFHSLTIMNRLNTTNLIEPIVREFEYQMQAPFLLYRNSRNRIFGIWFYNREECVHITYLIESLMEGIRDKPITTTTSEKAGVDIFSMLTKAQEDFNRTPSLPEPGTPMPQPQCSSTPMPQQLRVADMTSQSVMDFFSKAASKSNKQVATTPGEGENIIHRLMSNPAHSVEHIEKQQRSITPQEAPRPAKPPGDRRSVPIAMPVAAAAPCPRPENGLNSFVPGCSPPRRRHPLPPAAAAASSPLAQFLAQTHASCAASAPDDGEPLLLLGTSPLETPPKPSLMPPTMFTAAAAASATHHGGREKAVEPLTRAQMLQALTYLIKNDADFVTKLHEAYVKSITEMVASNSGGGPLL